MILNTFHFSSNSDTERNVGLYPDSVENYDWRIIDILYLNYAWG